MPSAEETLLQWIQTSLPLLHLVVRSESMLDETDALRGEDLLPGFEHPLSAIA